MVFRVGLKRYDASLPSGEERAISFFQGLVVTHQALNAQPRAISSLAQRYDQRDRQAVDRYNKFETGHGNKLLGKCASMNRGGAE